MIAAHYLDELREKEIDSALLACTHYPLIRAVIQDSLGPHVKLIEPAKCCSLKTKSWLASHKLLNLQEEKSTYEFYATDDPEKFRRLTNLFFGSEIKEVGEINH